MTRRQHATSLVAMFREDESHALFLLQQEGITRLDLLNYLNPVIPKQSGVSPGSRACTSARSSPGIDLPRRSGSRNSSSGTFIERRRPRPLGALRAGGAGAV